MSVALPIADTSPRGLRGSPGLTLPELLMALVVTGLAVGAIFSFQNYQLRTLANTAQQIDLQSTARAVAELVAREVRRAGANPECSPDLSAIEEATSTRIRVQTDLPPYDGLIRGTGEDITYRFDADSRVIRRIDHQPEEDDEVLLEEIDLGGSRFSYFDSAGNELSPDAGGLDESDRDQVRRVRIDLAVATDVRDGTASASATTNVTLRNRFFVAANSVCTPVPTFPTPVRTGGQTAAPTGEQTPTSDETPGDSPSPIVPPCGGHNDPCTVDANCCSGYTCQQQGNNFRCRAS